MDLLKTCTVLDPKYKKLSFLNDKRELTKYYSTAAKKVNELNLEIDRFNESTSSITLSYPEDDVKDFPNIKKRIEKYVSFPKDFISKFYSKYGSLFARLGEAAKFYLITPATSVPTERLFSHAQYYYY